VVSHRAGVAAMADQHLVIGRELVATVARRSDRDSAQRGKAGG
jgi:DNA repair ATPase RecN